MLNFREIFQRAFKIYGIWPQASKQASTVPYFLFVTAPTNRPSTADYSQTIQNHTRRVGDWLLLPLIYYQIDSPQCFSHELLTVFQKTLLMYNRIILITQDLMNRLHTTKARMHRSVNSGLEVCKEDFQIYNGGRIILLVTQDLTWVNMVWGAIILYISLYLFDCTYDPIEVLS